jgi:PAS domain S-box-containing protein
VALGKIAQAQPAPVEPLELSEYVLEVLRKDDEFILYRGRHRNLERTVRRSILLLAPSSPRPSPALLKEIDHQYSLSSELGPEWAVRPLAVSHDSGSTVLVLEDPGGMPLDRLIREPIELRQSLRLAVSIAGALKRLHERGLVHKNLEPSNILTNSVTGQVWLMGFGIASRLRRERQLPEPPEFVAGTLPYMAPEQTGRMNRSIDSRTDLYAFGVTLYEMLTGSLPFTASSAMEWVHCHIARQPVSPSDLVKNVPGTVAAITLKLMAKTAEERYQTAAGAESDLRRCLNEWETQHRIEEFALGTYDTPDELLIPEKLYGREREIDTLLAAFDRVVASGRPELVLVSGYAGIGKSSVVNELHKAIVPPRGLFAAGKFDQHKRDIPYATLAQAFRSLIRPILGKPESELSKCRDDLRQALTPNGLLVTDLVPELKLIIGEQPAVPDLTPADAKARIQGALRRFIGVFASAEHPLALFLDDLQWLDAATLDLLEDLLIQDDLRHLLLIAAYRDNEVDSSHPLLRKLAAIRETATVQEIILTPLGCEDLGRLVADSLHCEPQRALSLAQLVHEKTNGNPFFAIQFIQTLAEEGLIAFDHGDARWSWDLQRIRAKGYTDNVVDLMVEKLNRLPVAAQKALEELACFGNVADAATLSAVRGTSEEETQSDLWEALQLELVLRGADSYRFVHDRVQEAAYSRIPEELRSATHLRVGRLLNAQISPEKREESIFEIVNQLNRGSSLIASCDEREHLAELNLIAGKRAKASTAYASALKYLIAGAELLATDSWDRQHDLAFHLEFHRAECEFLTAAAAAAAERLAMLSSYASNTIQQATVVCLQIDVYLTLGQLNRALGVCLDYLRGVGIDWQPHLSKELAREEYERLWRKLGSSAVGDLVGLPLMTDTVSIATLDVLTKITPVAAAGATDLHFLALLVGRMVNLSLEGGNTDASCCAYEYVGHVPVEYLRDRKDAVRFGRLGYELVEKHGLMRFKSATYASFLGSIVEWAEPFHACCALTRHVLDEMSKTGDLTWVAFTRMILNVYLMAAGVELLEVQREAEQGLELALKMKFVLVADCIAPLIGLIQNLRGATRCFGSLNSDAIDELQIEQHFVDRPALAVAECLYFVCKLQARFFAGDYAAAADAAMKAERMVGALPPMIEVADYHLFAALTRAASCDSRSSGRNPEHFDALTVHHRQFEAYAENCPQNFATNAALIGAEIARIEGRELDAESLYEEAIRSAHANGLIHQEALGNELAARFYAARGLEKIADVYLRDARYGYVHWGAHGKVRQLDELHPHLREHSGIKSAGTIETSVEHLDLATIIKVSQAVSGEIDLQNLINLLMRTAIEHAGANKGLLILRRGNDLTVAAEATTEADTIDVRLRDVSVSSDLLPESIVNYVVRTEEAVILDDASRQNAFSSDPYVGRSHARSILCLHLANQGKFIGVLYLENTLASRAFTPTRVAVLKVLASQAAISLENSRLYSDLKEREAKIRRLVDANIVGVVIGNNVNGEITEVNDAFLKMLGYDRHDFISEPMYAEKLTPPEWHDVGARAIAEARASGAVPLFEKEYFRKDGSRLPVLVGGALFEGSENEGVAFVLDLSEQKRAEIALRKSEADLLEAQRLSHAGSWKLDLASGRVTVSPEIFRIFDAGPDEDVSSPEFWFDRIHSEDRLRVREYFERCLAQKLHYETDYRIVLPEGSIRYQHSIGHPILNESGALVEFLGTAIDVTEQVQARIKLEKAFEEIKQLKDRLQDENVVLREQVDQAFMFEETVGTSPSLKEVLSRVTKVAAADSTVLLTGETGTGKELIARAIHKRSRRSARAFVSVNCAAIPASLIASELFGHEKGAFTGALQRRLGRFELAEEGTLFLDEVGELPPETQVALLRALQEGEFQRVGSTETRHANVRVIAATNRDLEAAIAAGAFRNDLFYRLNVFPIELPPLRDRKEDIPLLVTYFIDRFARKAGKNIHGIDKKSMDLLLSYPWPGNIRELQNVIERSVVVCETETLSVDASWLSRQRLTNRPKGGLDLSQLAAKEKEMIEAALRESKGRVSGPSGAAVKLGVPGTTLESKIRSLHIDKSRFRTGGPAE